MALVSRLGTEVTGFGTRELASNQIEFFREHGYLAIERLLDGDEIERLESTLRDLLERPEPRADGMIFDYSTPDGDLRDPRVLQLLLPFDYQPALFETEFFRESAAIARDLLGLPLAYRGSHYIEKPPERDNPTPFHQDEAFWDPGSRHEAVAIWLPLEDATEENGALAFLPGSHRDQQVLPHRHVGDDSRVHALEVEPDRISLARAVLCPVSRGGATVHHCRTVHGTGPNRSGKSRRALVVNFAIAPSALERPRDFFWQNASDSGAARKRSERGIDLP